MYLNLHILIRLGSKLILLLFLLISQDYSEHLLDRCVSRNYIHRCLHYDSCDVQIN